MDKIQNKCSTHFLYSSNRSKFVIALIIINYEWTTIINYIQSLFFYRLKQLYNFEFEVSNNVLF